MLQDKSLSLKSLFMLSLLYILIHWNARWTSTELQKGQFTDPEYCASLPSPFDEFPLHTL